MNIFYSCIILLSFNALGMEKEEKPLKAEQEESLLEPIRAANSERMQGQEDDQESQNIALKAIWSKVFDKIVSIAQNYKNVLEEDKSIVLNENEEYYNFVFGKDDFEKVEPRMLCAITFFPGVHAFCDFFAMIVRVIEHYQKDNRTLACGRIEIEKIYCYSKIKGRHHQYVIRLIVPIQLGQSYVNDILDGIDLFGLLLPTDAPQPMGFYQRINSFVTASHKFLDPYTECIEKLRKHYPSVEKDGYLHLRGRYEKPKEVQKSKNLIEKKKSKKMKNLFLPYAKLEPSIVFKEPRNLGENQSMHSKNYKIHLMPHMRNLSLLIDVLTKSKTCFKCIRGLKVSLEQSCFNPGSKNIFPRVVVYLEDKKDAQKVLSYLMIKCAELSIKAVLKAPRFSAKVTDVIYYTQGNGDDKIDPANKEFFEQPDQIHFIHTYEDPNNQNTEIYHLH